MCTSKLTANLGSFLLSFFFFRLFTNDISLLYSLSYALTFNAYDQNMPLPHQAKVDKGFRNILYMYHNNIIITLCIKNEIESGPAISGRYSLTVEAKALIHVEHRHDILD